MPLINVKFGSQIRRISVMDKIEQDTWACPRCYFVLQAEKNTAMGFEDWTGKIVCPACNASMDKIKKGD
jgi:rubrerythrin